MSTELPGKVKRSLWVRLPCCTSGGESYRAGQKARADFRAHRKEEGTIDVIAPDVLDEAFELSEAFEACEPTG